MEKIGRVDLPGTQGIAFSSRKKIMYVSAMKDGGVVATFDISDPSEPKKLGEVAVRAPSYMEDMNLGERADGTEFVLVRGEGGGLQIVDVSNPTTPYKRGWLAVNAHTWTCVRADCLYAYGASPFTPVADLRDLDRPTATELDFGFHDWNWDAVGVMWGAGSQGIGAYNVDDARAPKRLNSSDHNGVAGLSEYNNMQLHGSLRPNAKRFQLDLDASNASVEDGNVLIASEETNDQDCTDSISTWYIPHLDATRYQADNPLGADGRGSISPLASWSLLKNTTPGVNRPPTGQGRWCSVHWFDYHHAGFIVVPTYEQGTHLLDVRDAKVIRQVGYHFTPGNHAHQSYWVPKRDNDLSTRQELVYTADGGSEDRAIARLEPISGGIDIFRVTLPK